MRLTLLPIAIVGELALLAICWIIALVAPQTAQPIKDWAVNNLPDQEWYFRQ